MVLLKEKQEEHFDLDKYLKTNGIVLIVLGFLHFLLPQYLMFAFGALLIFIGAFSLIFRIRLLLIVFGVLLIFLGLWNLFMTVQETSSFWIILGLFQIYWGIKEIKQFFKTKGVKK